MTQNKKEVNIKDEELSNASQPSQNEKKKKCRTHTFVKTILILFLILIIIAGVVLWYINDKLNKIQTVDINENELKACDEPALTNYRNIAILGIDHDDNDLYDVGRSDCIIIASINEDTKQIKLISVYRDTYLEIAGRGLDKVNHAYEFGGPALSMRTLNTNLDLDISEFVTVNFTAMKNIVDALGGLELTVTNAEATRIPRIETGGTYLLNGEQALAYARIRKIDSDYVRTERMRTVVNAIFQKVKTMNIVELNKLIDKLLPELYTNITKTEILSLIPQIASYSIIDSEGWPYDTKAITLDRYYGVPVTLESNVIKLHQEVLGQTDYTPSQTVKDISTRIMQKTGYTN